jgi:hypothetical protein
LSGIISWLAGLMRKFSWLISMFYPGITEITKTNHEKISGVMTKETII